MQDSPATSPSREDWIQVFLLLDVALELDPTARLPWLASLPPEQTRLAPLLETLLQTHDRSHSDDFLQTPAAFVLAAPVQTQIGPYRLLHEIGQGGMATVWLAERADGLLDRRIALKLPHPGWGDAARGPFSDRMARERNILASLTHPHIARLYDAGLTAEGRPYLALEYVEGEPIDRYAAEHGLALRARIGLIVQVARAVAHAHARLVVHRDLKPSNILVDASGQAHLLDFGIAALVDAQQGDGVPASRPATRPAPPSAPIGHAPTQSAGRALTPDYASPEQIRGDAIGTASDVYSLGVVLFELLVGERPYRLERGLGAAALAEAIERVQTPRASATVATGPPATTSRLRRQLEGDLDAILARALAKESSERYASVDALADDLERHLRGEPVHARPDTRWYRTERWVRRHKLETAVGAAILVAVPAGAAAQAAVLVAIAGGAGAALWQARKAREQASEARRQAKRAQAVQGFLLDIFRANSDKQADPVKARSATARELLDLGARRLETALQDEPEARAEVMQTLGEMYYQLQLDEDAAAIETRRIALLKQVHGANDTRVAEALIGLAASLHATSRRDEILPVLEEARRILDANGDQRSRLRGHLLTRLAQRHQNVSFEKMQAYADEAVAVLRAHAVPNEDRLGTALHLAARARVQLGAPAEGEQLYRESLVEVHKETPVAHVGIVQALVALGECQAMQHKVDAALQTFRDAAETGRKALGESDPGVIAAQSRLAALLHATGRREEGRRLHEDALRRVLEVKSSHDTLFTPIVRMDFGRSLFAEGRLREALELVVATNESNSRHYQGSAVLGQGLRMQATICTALGRYDEARNLFAQAQVHWLQGTGSGIRAWRHNRFVLDAAGLDLALGDAQTAIDQLGKVAPHGSPNASQPSPDEVERDTLLSRAHLQIGDSGQALRFAGVACARLAAFAVPAWFPSLDADARQQLAQAWLLTGDAVRARSAFGQALALRVAHEDAASPWIAEAQIGLAHCWLASGDLVQATAALEVAARIQDRHDELGAHFVQALRAGQAALAAQVGSARIGGR